MRVFFSAGEASGDRYAASLVAELRAQGSSAGIEGIGGRLLAGAADGPVMDSSSWGAISISQSAKVAVKIWLSGQIAKRELRAGDPGLLIPIDFGFFNIRLCRAARAAGWKVLYFIPPGSWRRDRQGADIPKIADEIVTPFPWSADTFKSMGADAHWFGHPLKQLIVERPPDGQPRDRIAVLPGSRRHEIALNLPLVAAGLKDREEQVEFAVAPSLDVAWVRSVWDAAGGRSGAVFTQGDTYGVLWRARAGVICSGTATLEAALCGCPTVVVYKLSRMMAFEVAVVRPHIKFVSLPNIILNREVVPELVHKKALPAPLAVELGDLLVDGPKRQAQLAAFKELDDLLGPSDALTQTAKLAASMIGPR